jgi:hypothetical protein
MGSGCESNWRKIIGKPYAGKLHVRFDEGELEIGPSATTPVLYSTEQREQVTFRDYL